MSLEQARLNMVVQQIRPWYVWDERVLDAMTRIPREQFVPPEYGRVAYSDMTIPLPHNEKMLPPKVIARMLDAANIQPHEKVLEIGTGTGYTTTILAHLCQEVVSVEIAPDLLAAARAHLQAHKNVKLIEGDASNGWAQEAPFDVIFTGGAYALGIPQTMLDQLNPGGRIIAICSEAPAQHAVLMTKNSTVTQRSLFECEAPYLKNSHHKKPFIF